MSAMEPSTVSQPPASESVRTDSTVTKAYGDRHFKPVVAPGLGGRPLLPESVRKFFRRKDAPAAR
jgi:hypothetical protein